MYLVMVKIMRDYALSVPTITAAAKAMTIRFGESIFV